jgi:hypothetical protein
LSGVAGVTVETSRVIRSLIFITPPLGFALTVAGRRAAGIGARADRAAGDPNG